MRAFWLVTLFFIATPVQAETPKPYPLGLNHAYEGYIDHGSKFGVTVGQTREEARSTLVGQGLRDDGQWSCDKVMQLDFQCHADDPLDSYRIKRFLYDGQVFIFFKDDVVSAIAWDATTIYIDL